MSKASYLSLCLKGVALVFLTWLVGAPCRSFAGESGGLPDQARADFEWFSTLGFPEVKGRPYVKVATGEYWQSQGELVPHNTYLTAFLLATNADSFRVVTRELIERTFFTTNAAAPAHARVGYEVVNLSNEVAKVLIELKTPPEDDLAAWGRRFGERLSERAQVFALGWACWRNGFDGLAQELYEQAQVISKRNRRQPPATFRDGLAQDLAYAKMWGAVSDFGDPTVTRPQLLARFEAILTNYPHTDQVPRAAGTAARLKLMIAEDAAHAATGRTNLSELTVTQQVAELIFRLRDQNGHQYMQPGSCDIFASRSGDTHTPAHQLVALGYAAVPQLIAAFDDPTFTRSVGYHRNFYFSHNVLTVGDCAQIILQSISGKSFYHVRGATSDQMKAGQISPARQAAEAWWVEFQQKGEQQMLVEGVVAAGNESQAMARMLVERYPEVAPDALIRGAEANTNTWIRSRLIEEMAGFSTPEIVAFLRRELRNGPALKTRVVAAYGLRQRPAERDAAITAMIREWQTNAFATETERDEAEDLVEFLAETDSVAAMEALRQDWKQRPIELRLKVVDEVLEPFSNQAEDRSAAVFAAAEACLVAALEDTEARLGMSGSRGGKSYSDPRVCDMAAWRLADKWPDRYTFDITASLSKRNRQRVVCLNTWRRAHGQAELPVPSLPATRVPPEQANRVTRIEWVKDSAPGRRDFIARLEALQDKALEAKALVEFLASFAAHGGTNVYGLELMAIKEAELTGVLLQVRWLPGKLPQEPKDWSMVERVDLGVKNVYNLTGGLSAESDADSEHWSDLRKAITKVLAARPEEPFEISIHLSVEEEDSP